MKSVRVSIISLCFCMLFLSAVAQKNKRGLERYYLNPKFGSYSALSSGGFAMGGEISAGTDRYAYSLNYYYLEEFDLFGPSPYEYYHQIGFTMGKYKIYDIFGFQYEAGLGSFWGRKRADIIEKGSSSFFPIDIYSVEQFFTIGLIAKLGFRMIPLPFFSIGLDLQTNLNFTNPAAMYMLSIEIGKIRPRL